MMCMMFWPLSQERYAARTQSTGLILQPFDAHPARQWVEEQLTPMYVLTPFYCCHFGAPIRICHYCTLASFPGLTWFSTCR